MAGVKLITGEIYHIYNRGVDKRDVFLEHTDLLRFIDGLIHFNNDKPIESLYVHSFRSAEEKKLTKGRKLVNLLAYCLNPNHYHLIIQQLMDNGISEFMKRVGGGYTNFFNEKNKRTGALFQGKFKRKHVTDNDQLLHLSAYVNLNNKVHGYSSSITKSSWEEYAESRAGICNTKLVTKQFTDPTDYKSFALGALDLMRETKQANNHLETLTLD